MDVLLPSTVEELNLMQSPMDLPSPTLFCTKAANKGFENIFVEKRYKREVSLPNGVANWNISNIESYLDFEDLGESKVNGGDRLVPEETDQRLRSESFSSVSSTMEDKLFPAYGMKSFNTVCMDSGSTCISRDHSYVGNQAPALKGFDVEETYQNLDMFLQQVPEISISENLPSPLSSGGSDSNFSLTHLHPHFSLPSPPQQDLDFSSSTKRSFDPSSEDEVFVLKRQRPQEDPRRKNNASSKTCRKTRKEKQSEMEVRVTDLEKEKEELKVEVQVLEELIQAHKMRLYAILQKR